MKNKKICFIVMLVLLIASGQIYVVHSVSSSAQDRALAFIENVLPIDSTNFNIELKVDGNATDIPKELDTHNTFANNDKVLIYFLGSMVGTADSLDVILVIRDNNFFQGVVNIDYAPSYDEFGDPTKVDDIKNFLANYQNWSGLDSTKMIEMLSNVDIAKNTSIISGDVTMTIQRTDASDNVMEIRWAYATNGTQAEFEVSFKKGFPVNFYDERQIPSSTPTPTPTITQHPTINTGPEPPQTKPFPTTLAIASVLSVAVIGVGLLVYFKKRKRGLVAV